MSQGFEQEKRESFRWLHAYRWPVAAVLLLAEWPAFSSAQETFHGISLYEQAGKHNENPISDLHNASVALVVVWLVLTVFIAFLLPEMVRFGILKAKSVFQVRLSAALFAPVLVLVIMPTTAVAFMNYYSEVGYFDFTVDNKSAFGEPFYALVSFLLAAPLALMAGASLLLGSVVSRVKSLKKLESAPYPLQAPYLPQAPYPQQGPGYPGYYPR